MTMMQVKYRLSNHAPDLQKVNGALRSFPKCAVFRRLVLALARGQARSGA